MEQPVSHVAPGGGFLVTPVPRGEIFSRDQCTEDQLEFMEAARNFVRNEVLPRMEEIEHGAKGENGEPLALELSRQAAELGLTAVDIEEEYEGLGLDFTSSMLVSEQLSGCTSFAVTLGAHCGIGTHPIHYFGNAEQKAKYLPKLATMEVVSCYGRTEPGNGSDALHGRTTAVLSEDGTHYLLTGQKQFITNAGFADMCVVFANIEGKYSGLIVNLRQEGVQRGAEEKKMGIHGSSTAGLVFENVKVPVEDLLGEIGDGPKIALNILYVGRLKLAMSAMGGTKVAIEKTIKFQSERKQFGRSVAEFDLQKGKLGEIVAWTYGSESMLYRMVGDINEHLERLPEGAGKRGEIEVMRRYGLECAIAKIHSTETAGKVYYHAVRMHGGYGFCEEYSVERLVRDNVVDTIYEGTNDINRIVAGGALVEAAYMGSIPFLAFVDEVKNKLENDDLALPVEGYMGEEVNVLTHLKRALTYTIEQVLVGIGKDVKVEQQVQVFLVDALTSIYVAESALARTIGVGEGHPQAGVRRACTGILIHESEHEVARLCRDALAHVEAEDRHFENLERLLVRTRRNVIALKREVAAHAREVGCYDLEK